MRRLCVIFGLCALLSGCYSVEQPVGLRSQASSVSSIAPAETNSGTALDGPLVETETPDVTEEDDEESGSGALLEQVGSGGILTVGKPGALNTLTVFTNPSCAYCTDFWNKMFPMLADDLIATGRMNVRIVTVPLKKYPNSAVEAAAILCAGRSNVGLRMQQELALLAKHDRKSVIAAATGLKFDAKVFGACLDAKETTAQLAAGQALIAQHNVTLIPTFVLNDSLSTTGLPSAPDLRGWIVTHLH